MDQTFNELDLTSLLSLSFSTLITELHDKLNELGFEDIRPAHGFMFKRILPNGATGIELAEYLGVSKQAVSKWWILLRRVATLHAKHILLIKEGKSLF